MMIETIDVYDLTNDDVETFNRTNSFTIITPERAAYAADRVLTERERLKRIKASCAVMIREAERALASTEAFYLPALEQWARRNPPKKGKTIRLPTGTLAFRSVPGGPRVVDKAATLAWAGVNLPLAVHRVERLSRSEINAYVSQTGDLPPGVEFLPARETFDVKG